MSELELVVELIGVLGYILYNICNHINGCKGEYNREGYYPNPSVMYRLYEHLMLHMAPTIKDISED